ncbi:ABC transporter substrate-binding protein [Mycobacteroides immunogenum]|uniref:Iron ABC transporter substrate-binding protein n=1 Tax=Mycobacteroides immunogenum TaxID=83262 RepID=A0A7V8LUB2_9MYCO|nr:ABC transporter substrate-binding protein [Mycobacteroides immunogenum]AMT72979.1 iron ABC transporter substrate-binding protein [Mycobacteroides immunogenum]ANO06139.1 iron ABC transporter substrate-binding protein [Mycobacteroides immunogenum]KIU41880.1 iron ABC transporter substrate-binding protein [Mycobacteroides immunogenum]KPG11694.1 iron ABC transporter substrate-binding protein [Mycobacteroides immunogenum]KPG11818.1 iron ABC transporter substrate-binding protein [Mycobacteroides i
MITRRGLLAAGAGLAASTALAACSRESAPTSERDGTAIIKHAFGTTEVKAAPKRVVSAGYTGQDYLLALGIVPVAVTEWYGGFPFATWPWATDRLGGGTPEVLTLTDGLMIDKITSLKPDLIVAADAGLDQDTYSKLAGIAPTIAQSGRYAFFEPWKDQAKAIGQAVFKPTEMAAVVQAVDNKFSAAASAHTGFKDKKVIYLQGELLDGQAIAYRSGPRTGFLSGLGLLTPTELETYAKGDQLAQLPSDQLATVLAQADVLLWGTESDEQTAALKADPALTKLGPSLLDRSIFTSKELAGAINFSSPLSLTYVVDNLVPQLARILG